MPKRMGTHEEAVTYKRIKESKPGMINLPILMNQLSRVLLSKGVVTSITLRSTSTPLTTS